MNVKEILFVKKLVNQLMFIYELIWELAWCTYTLLVATENKPSKESCIYRWFSSEISKKKLCR